MHANGIPLDTATIVSTVLEGIPHGESKRDIVTAEE